MALDNAGSITAACLALAYPALAGGTQTTTGKAIAGRGLAFPARGCRSCTPATAWRSLSQHSLKTEQ